MIDNTSNTALRDKCEDIVNKMKFLFKALKLCKSIKGDLLIRIIEKIDTNSNTLLR